MASCASEITTSQGDNLGLQGHKQLPGVKGTLVLRSEPCSCFSIFIAVHKFLLLKLSSTLTHLTGPATNNKSLVSVQWGHTFRACCLQVEYWHYRKSRGSSNSVLCTVPTTSNLHQGRRKPFPAWNHHHQYCCYAAVSICQENAAEKTPHIPKASYKGHRISLHIQFL